EDRDQGLLVLRVHLVMLAKYASKRNGADGTDHAPPNRPPASGPSASSDLLDRKPRMGAPVAAEPRRRPANFKLPSSPQSLQFLEEPRPSLVHALQRVVPAIAVHPRIDLLCRARRT